MSSPIEMEAAGLYTRNHFPVEVDYTKSLADMVEVGKYNYANSYVNNDIVAKNFPIACTCTGVVKTELVLVDFDRDIGSEAAIKELEQMGLVPCEIEYLLALGAKYPYLQKERPIVCLGSSWVNPNGDRGVPCLNYWNAKRKLHLISFGIEWPRRSRFAARKL